MHFLLLLLLFEAKHKFMYINVSRYWNQQKVKKGNWSFECAKANIHHNREKYKIKDIAAKEKEKKNWFLLCILLLLVCSSVKSLIDHDFVHKNSSIYWICVTFSKHSLTGLIMPFSLILTFFQSEILLFFFSLLRFLFITFNNNTNWRSQCKNLNGKFQNVKIPMCCMKPWKYQFFKKKI